MHDGSTIPHVRWGSRQDEEQEGDAPFADEGDVFAALLADDSADPGRQTPDTAGLERRRGGDVRRYPWE